MKNNNNEDIGRSTNQWFSQIIFLTVICFLLIAICNFLLILEFSIYKSLNMEINMRMPGDISSSLLILLILPTGLFFWGGLSLPSSSCINLLIFVDWFFQVFFQFLKRHIMGSVMNVKQVCAPSSFLDLF